MSEAYDPFSLEEEADYEPFDAEEELEEEEQAPDTLSAIVQRADAAPHTENVDNTIDNTSSGVKRDRNSADAAAEIVTETDNNRLRAEESTGDTVPRRKKSRSIPQIVPKSEDEKVSMHYIFLLTLVLSIVAS